MTERLDGLVCLVLAMAVVYLIITMGGDEETIRFHSYRKLAITIEPYLLFFIAVYVCFRF